MYWLAQTGFIEFLKSFECSVGIHYHGYGYDGQIDWSPQPIMDCLGSLGIDGYESFRVSIHTGWCNQSNFSRYAAYGLRYCWVETLFLW